MKEKLIYLIRKIYKDNSILEKIKKNQRQYSDKNVYNNIDQILKKIIEQNSLTDFDDVKILPNSEAVKNLI